MNILVLNGSPRPHGNTAALVGTFTDEAQKADHHVSVFHFPHGLSYMKKINHYLLVMP